MRDDASHRGPQVVAELLQQGKRQLAFAEAEVVGDGDLLVLTNVEERAGIRIGQFERHYFVCSKTMVHDVVNPIAEAPSFYDL